VEITTLGCIKAFAGIFLVLVVLSPFYGIHLEKERVRSHKHVLKTIKEQESKAQ